MATVTKKKEKKLMSLPAEYRTLIYQPNRITNAHYSFTLIQERIFVYIVYYLKTYVIKVMDGAYIRQLDMFTHEQDKEYIDISIPLAMIGKPNQYNEIRERANEMVSLRVRIMDKNRQTGESIERVQGLITHVDHNAKDMGKRTGILPIRMSKMVAMLMLNVERENGCPINYTSFLFDVALCAENKYTPRIYKLLASWRKKEVYKVKLSELREILQLEDKYKDYEAFKRRILVPVMLELNEKGDFTFDCNADGFEIREGKKVVSLVFRHIFPKDLDDTLTECKLWNRIVITLKRAWDIDDKGIALITKLKDKYPAREIEAKIQEAYVWRYRPDVIGNPNKKITNPAHYITRTIFREFPLEV